MSFESKRALVTGAASGIGRAVAERFAREGAVVGCVDISVDGLRETTETIVARRGNAVGFVLDMANAESIEDHVRHIAASIGPIDILVNAAGIVQSEPFFDVTVENWNRIININQRGTAFMTQAVSRLMVAQVPEPVRRAGIADRCYGKIVNFSSVSGRRGRAYQLHYAASKAAIISLTQSAALALAPFGINVNAVCPSVVKTPMWEAANRGRAAAAGIAPEEAERRFVAQVPLGRPGTPEEVAAAVSFLCSSDADFITGQTLNVDGGYEMD